MSTQAQMEEIRRLSGEHNAARPPDPEPQGRPPVRIAVTTLILALAGVGLLHWMLDTRFTAKETRAGKAAAAKAVAGGADETERRPDGPSLWYAVAFALAPFVIVLALSFVTGRESVLALIACAVLLVTLFAYRQWALRTFEEELRAATRATNAEG